MAAAFPEAFHHLLNLLPPFVLFRDSEHCLSDSIMGQGCYREKAHVKVSLCQWARHSPAVVARGESSIRSIGVALEVHPAVI